MCRRHIRRLLTDNRLPVEWGHPFPFILSGASTIHIAGLSRSWTKQLVTLASFIDLEKAYDSMPREEIWRSSRERSVPEKYTYQASSRHVPGVKTVVRSAAGESNSFGVTCSYSWWMCWQRMWERTYLGQWRLQMTLYYAVMTRQTWQSTWRPGGMH